MNSVASASAEDIRMRYRLAMKRTTGREGFHFQKRLISRSRVMKYSKKMTAVEVAVCVWYDNVWNENYDSLDAARRA